MAADLCVGERIAISVGAGNKKSKRELGNLKKGRVGTVRAVNYHPVYEYRGR